MQAGIRCLDQISEQTYTDAARFADGTLTGLWNSTGGALVGMASHPGETALGLLSLAAGSYTNGLIGTDPRAAGQALAEDIIAKASSGDPRDAGLFFGEGLGTLLTVAVGGELSSITKATEPVAWASRAGEAGEAATAARTAASDGLGFATQPFGPTDIQFGPVPQNACDTLATIHQTGGAPPGFRGGGPFTNDPARGQLLPQTTSDGTTITYQEWDVNPFVSNPLRGLERIVTGSDSRAYYTSTHYENFIQFWGPGQ